MNWKKLLVLLLVCLFLVAMIPTVIADDGDYDMGDDGDEDYGGEENYDIGDDDLWSDDLSDDEYEYNDQEDWDLSDHFDNYQGNNNLDLSRAQADEKNNDEIEQKVDTNEPIQKTIPGNGKNLDKNGFVEDQTSYGRDSLDKINTLGIIQPYGIGTDQDGIENPNIHRSELLDVDHDGVMDHEDSDTTKDTDIDNDGIDDAYDLQDNRSMLTKLFSWFGFI